MKLFFLNRHCKQCGAKSRTYQQRKCMDCLLAEFEESRALINRVRPLKPVPPVPPANEIYKEGARNGC